MADKEEDQKEEIYSYPELLRNTLQYLDSYDDDRATQRNDVGFSREDGDTARELQAKQEWNDEDLKEAFRIASHYKKTQLKEQWNKISESRKKYYADRKHEKMKQKPDGLWTPIEFENDVPVSYAGWYEGKPYRLRITESVDDVVETRYKITLRNHDGEAILGRIRRLMINQMDMVEFDGEIFPKSEFVNMMVYPANCNIFTECLNSLPMEEGAYREPKFYIEDGHIKFPQKYYARRDDSYQLILKNSLSIGPVVPELYQEGLNLLRKHPKQLTLHYAIIGANVMNVLDYEDYLITIDAIGESDTGKSFAINLTLQMDYGISHAKMNDDALMKAFRHHAIAGSTNLPIYIEEALMDEKSLSRLKSTGKNVRGNADKSLTLYDVLATFVFSRNTESKEIRNIDPMERKAQDKRIFKFIFEKDDMLTDEVEKSIGRDFFKRIKDIPGGMLYEKLKNKTETEIRSKYRSLKQEESLQSERDKKEPSQINVISKLGAWIMDDPDFEPKVTEPKQPTILDEFFSILRDEHERIEYMMELAHRDEKYKAGTYLDKELSTNLDIDVNHEFKLTVHGFNLIKKNFGYNETASAFARSYGFEYKTVSIFGRHDKCIIGQIPKVYFEEEKSDKAEGQNKTLPKTEEDEEEKAELTETIFEEGEFDGPPLSPEIRKLYKEYLEGRPKELTKEEKIKKELDSIGL